MVSRTVDRQTSTAPVHYRFKLYKFLSIQRNWRAGNGGSKSSRERPIGTPAGSQGKVISCALSISLMEYQQLKTLICQFIMEKKSDHQALDVN